MKVKQKIKQQVKQQHISDPRLAIRMADAYKNLAETFINNILKQGLNEAAEFSIKNLGDFIASVTNLVLAVELYLKALQKVCGLKVARDHNLWNLYRHLPDKLKFDIEREYELSDVAKDGIAVCLRLRLRIKGLQVEEEDGPNNKNQRNENDLKKILQKSQYAFVTWRYLYEMDILF